MPTTSSASAQKDPTANSCSEYGVGRRGGLRGDGPLPEVVFFVVFGSRMRMH